MDRRAAKGMLIDRAQTRQHDPYHDGEAQAMTDAVDLLATAKLGEQALASMLRWTVPTTPQNYLVWYTHHSGTMPELSRVIRRLETEGQTIDHAQCGEIYEKFFCRVDEGRAVKEAGDRLETTIARLTEVIEQGSSGANQYHDSLGAFAGELENVRSADALGGILTAIRSQTRQMLGHVKGLEAGLAHATDEARSLRQDLERAQGAANTDPLTGLRNRRYLYELLRELVVKHQRSREDLSMAVVDLDHFKRFNDTFGHQIGDQILKLVAAKLVASVAKTDLVARWGGEEFVVVLPGRSIDETHRILDQVRATVGERKVTLKNSGRDLGHVTISVGLAQLRASESLQQMISRADRALYAAKAGGRNRVMLESFEQAGAFEEEIAAE